jgi:hypothetical protein
MKASWTVAPQADPHMSQNAPRPGRPPTSAPIRPANDVARLRTASVRQDARRARTPTEQQVNTITRVGILSRSEGEGSSPPVTDQPSFPSFWS